MLTTQFRASLLLLNCFALVALQILTGVCFLDHNTLGPVADSSIPYFFFGINVPTILLAGFGPRVRFKWSSEPFLIVVMALIMMNFMRAASMSGDWKTLSSLLHVLSAQSLWIAFPAYWMASHPQRQGTLL